METFDCTKYPPKKTEPCSENKCITTFRDVVKILPECSIKGVQLKKEYSKKLENLEDACEKAVGSSMTTPLITTAPPSSTPTATNATATTDAPQGECTDEQLTTLKKSDGVWMFLTLDCGDPKPMPDAVCGACVPSAEGLVKAAPACTYKGINIKDDFTATMNTIKSQCGKATSGAAPSNSTKSELMLFLETATNGECSPVQANQYPTAERDQAERAVCSSPPGTGSLVAAQKICSKPCQDEYAKSLSMQPNCTIDGVNQYELAKSDFDELIGRSCEQFNKQLEASKAPAAATSAASGTHGLHALAVTALTAVVGVARFV